jgi:transglutaminase-like putative cysteine protease
MKSIFFSLFSFLFCNLFFAQKPEYNVSTISDSLKLNANAVIRLSSINVTILSQNSMLIQTKVVTTVLNEFGLKNLTLSDYYDKNRKIAKIEATVFDALGKEIKSFKKKDFRDVSVADGISIFNDNRALYLDYTPITYPFTLVFESQIETSNTAFIPSWSPINDYYVSVEKTVFSINFKTELNLKIKEENFSSKIQIEKKETSTSKNYSSIAINAIKKEELAPSLIKFSPMVYFALENFNLENVLGKAANWNEFGKWYYNALLADTEEIPDATVQKLKQLIGNEKRPLEIAKMVYNYVQEKTRYVSVQVGIGGWKPMLAKDVDKLGYGDCKALTNYTRSLLKSLGVQSYFTVVYAGNNKRNIKEDISSIQGNHVILTLPIDNDLIWLECTSQIQPFGFQGELTDDRNVLLIKPDGGEIVKTKTFDEKDNLKKITGSYSISENGMIKGNLKMISFGIQYDNEFQKERMSKEDQIKHYKEEFSNINNLKLKKISFLNDKNAIQFTEEIEIEAENYAQNTGGKYMFALNAFDQSSYVPKKYRNRELPFEIERGFTNEEEITITLPEGFSVEAKPNGVELATEFGSYKIDFISSDNKNIICKRKLIINKGFYESSKFENYRKFREAIAKTDNSKVIISKT